jgi:putative ABC transport system substrate-binding protein
MRRRDFIIAIAGSAATAWARPLAAPTAFATPPLTSPRRAVEGAPAPVVGFLSATTREPEVCFAALRRGLDETGFREDQTVAIEYRWAEDNYDRLPTIVDELSHLGVRTIVAANYPAADSNDCGQRFKLIADSHSN